MMAEELGPRGKARLLKRIREGLAILASKTAECLAEIRGNVEGSRVGGYGGSAARGHARLPGVPRAEKDR